VVKKIKGRENKVNRSDNMRGQGVISWFMPWFMALITILVLFRAVMAVGVNSTIALIIVAAAAAFGELLVIINVWQCFKK
jgi:hypothetical protein